MWQNAKGMPIFQLDMPTCQKACRVFNLACDHAKSHANFSNCHGKVSIFQYHLPTGVPFFQLFSKKNIFGIFQLYLTFANFKNIWTILEHLSFKIKYPNFKG